MERILTADLVVVGAGLAGMAAAEEAAVCGMDVLLVDEAALGETPARVRSLFGHVVWTVTPGFRVEAIGPAGRVTIGAERLVAATGAMERVVPFPGWTLPGVVGLSDMVGVQPGQRVVLAGCGAQLEAAEDRLRARGAAIAAIAALPSHAVRQADGDGAVQRVQIGPVDAEGRPMGDGQWIEADVLCVGYGLIPEPGIASLLRAPHHFDPARGAWVPVLDAVGRTGIAGLYAAGGAAGFMDGKRATSTGRRAGRTAARDAGGAAPDDEGVRETTVSPAWPIAGLVDAIPPDTIVCRCEGVTRAGIEAAIADGAHEMNQIKHFTRCGMGVCQGRRCADTVATLLARHVGSRTAAGRWTVRPPLRPVPLEALLGSFDYSDIPVPQPAPL
jgi:bacterioferritin-associated ferredoxin